jgi:predicted secreted protein
MTTNADIGYGTLIKKRTSTGPDVYTTLGEQTAVNPPNLAADAIDATHSESADGYREFIGGLKDGGEVSLEMNYVPASTAETLILAGLGELDRYRVVFPDGSYVTYDAILTGFEPNAPIDDKMSATATWKVSGKPTMTAASAPTNVVLPALGGTLEVGETLYAFPGVWDAEPTSFTYVWKNGGVAIEGATSQSYELQASDEGDTITVTVTGTNSAGSASATSAGSAAIAA